MKKLVALITALILSACLVSCGNSDTDVSTEREFPLDEEAVTKILHDNDIPLYSTISYYDETDQNGKTLNFAIDSYDEADMTADEIVVFGTLQLSWGGEDGRSVTMICMEDDGEYADISNTKNLKKIAMAACDFYGGIADRDKIANYFVKAVKNGDIYDENSVLSSWNAEYDGLYFSASFLPAHDDMPVTFRDFEIYDRTRKQWYDGRWERALQTMVDMNPYMFTMEDIQHPDAPSADEINRLIAHNSLGLSVTGQEEQGLTAGRVQYMYMLTAPGEEKYGAVAAIRYSASGKSTAVQYMPTQSDICLSDISAKTATEIACAIYGGVENADELARKVQTAVDNKDFEYNSYGEPCLLIEHEGLYCLPSFGTLMNEDGTKGPQIVTSVGIYNIDSLRAAIYVTKEHNSWHNDLYNRLYGE